MAVAAGVVIVAITNSSSDDLEEQSPNLESRCNGVEIHDPILAAAGVEGEVVGTVPARTVGPPDQRAAIPVNQKGSAVGCIPVCFWIEPSSGTGLEIGSDEIMFIRENRGADNFLNKFSRELPVLGSGDFTALFRDPTTLVHPIEGEDDVPLNDLNRAEGERILFASSLVDAVEVRVGPGQDDCFIYNSSGEIVG